MAERMPFMKAYPLSAHAAAHVPIVFRAGLDALKTLPWPSLEGLRDFAGFAGVADGALRTALSRAGAKGSLITQVDPDGRKRYVLAPPTYDMGVAQIHSDRRPEGFLIAVFSFRSEETEGRNALRGLLREYGFRKLAQNAYIHGRIATEGLRKAVRRLGLEDHLFLFTCPDIEDEELVKRILALFDIEARRAELRKYLELLVEFLPGNLGGDDLARRLLYVGAVHWERIEAREPPFPRRYMPDDYALGEIHGFYAEKSGEGAAALVSYYEHANR